MLETLPGKAWVNNTKIKLAIQNRPQKRDTTAKGRGCFSVQSCYFEGFVIKTGCRYPLHAASWNPYYLLYYETFESMSRYFTN